jgi:hypothetical protein
MTTSKQAEAAVARARARRDTVGECEAKGHHLGEGASLAKNPKGRAAETAKTTAEHRSAMSYHAAENARHEKAGNKGAAEAHAGAMEAHTVAFEKGGEAGSKIASIKAGIASDLAHQKASTAKKKIDAFDPSFGRGAPDKKPPMRGEDMTPEAKRMMAESLADAKKTKDKKKGPPARK